MMRSHLLPTGLLGKTAPASATTRPVPAPAEAAEAPAQPNRNDPPIPLPELGPCRHRPVLLILLFDNSPSVTGDNDPVGNRFEEAALALEHCARRCRCGQELVAVRTFDRKTSSDVGPFPLKGSGRRAVLAALVRPADLVRGTSRMRPALVAAEQLAHEYAAHDAVLVVFSDFVLLDPDPDWVVGRLARFPGPVHAILLGYDPIVRFPRRIQVTPVTEDSPRGVVARAVVEALGSAA